MFVWTCRDVFCRSRIPWKDSESPCDNIEDRTIVVRGKWIRIAKLLDEDFQEQGITDPELVVSTMRLQKTKADIFTFVQKLPDLEPRYTYMMEPESLAVIPITSFENWWEGRISKKVRQDVARARRMGVTVQEVDFDDSLIPGIVGIFKESRVRQGRRFWNYGKDFETVKTERVQGFRHEETNIITG
jgi:hypothetical protein